MLILIVVLSIALPIMTITAFVIGYNINAQKKILKLNKKHKKTDSEILLEQIENVRA